MNLLITCVEIELNQQKPQMNFSKLTMNLFYCVALILSITVVCMYYYVKSTLLKIP